MVGVQVLVNELSNVFLLVLIVFQQFFSSIKHFLLEEFFPMLNQWIRFKNDKFNSENFFRIKITMISTKGIFSGF